MYAIHVLMFKSHYFYKLPSAPVNDTIRCKVHVCMVKILLLCFFSKINMKCKPRSCTHFNTYLTVSYISIVRKTQVNDNL